MLFYCIISFEFKCSMTSLYQQICRYQNSCHYQKTYIYLKKVITKYSSPPCVSLLVLLLTKKYKSLETWTISVFSSETECKAFMILSGIKAVKFITSTTISALYSGFCWRKPPAIPVRAPSCRLREFEHLFHYLHKQYNLTTYTSFVVWFRIS